ncbi:MAG: DUF167 domain-containing protein [Nanoarchaeota archaeon]|nr:DUF167 domain-containing protein [Nanoarchaeota archaeon]
MWYKRVPFGFELTVRVRPGSGSFRIRKTEDSVTIFLKQQAAGGKANQELMTHLSKLFGKKVSILSGKTGRKKLLLLHGGTEFDLQNLE